MSEIIIDPTSGRPFVAGYCPSCGHESLFLATDGKVVCSNFSCTGRTLVDYLLRNPETEHIVLVTDDGWTIQHPLRERPGDGLFDCALQKHLASLDRRPGSPGRYRVTENGDGTWSWARTSEG
jgi:hypothetical protein